MITNRDNELAIDLDFVAQSLIKLVRRGDFWAFFASSTWLWWNWCRNSILSGLSKKSIYFL